MLIGFIMGIGIAAFLIGVPALLSAIGYWPDM